MNKHWSAIVDGRDMDNTEIIEAICEERGIEDLAEFLKPTSDALIDYEKLLNIDKAAQIVENAIDERLNICVLSDVDTDGVSSGSIIYRYLKHFTDSVTIDINEGKQHGVEDLETSADVLIVVDSINKAEEYHKFTDRGIQVVVLDHHIPPSDVGEYGHITLVSSAVSYPNPELSGAGVVWKFCKYLDELFLTDYADEYVDLAACGIVADMCSMAASENRYIVYEGLTHLSNMGLKKIVGSYKFDSQSISFSVAPLINACNRLSRNQLALAVLLTDNEDKAKQFVKEMKSVKTEQDSIVAKLMPGLIKEAERQLDRKVMFFVIDTEYGIAGLVANKLMSMYQRPILVLKRTDEGYAGSMRACGVDDFAAIVNKTGLATCEGHENAAGIEIPYEEFDRFIESLDARLSSVEFEESVIADVQLDLSQINTQLIQNFKTINYISGSGFKPLTVLIKDIKDYEVGNMSGGKHLKLITDDCLIIKWNFTDSFDEFEGNTVSIITELTSGYLGKTCYNQCIVQDYKLGG